MEEFRSPFLTGTVFVVWCNGYFGVCGPGLSPGSVLWCSCVWITLGVNLANSGKSSPFECHFNALQRWVIASSDHQLCCVWLRGADESHWAARGWLLLHWLPPIRCHRVGYWPRYVSYFFHHFTYILICFELWGRGEESLKPLQVPSFWVLEFNLFVTFLEVKFVSMPFYFLPVMCSIPSKPLRPWIFVCSEVLGSLSLDFTGFWDRSTVSLPSCANRWCRTRCVMWGGFSW